MLGTCFQAKGLAKQTDVAPDSGEWQSPKRRKKRNRPSNRGPTRSQREAEGTQVVTLQNVNRCQVLQVEDGSTVDSEISDTICSAGEETQMPLLTPRTADDLG